MLRSQLQSLHTAMEALSGGQWNKIHSGSSVYTNLVTMLEAKGVHKLQPDKVRHLTVQRLDVKMHTDE